MDRGGLAIPAEEMADAEEPSHSITTTEKILCEIWGEVIGLKAVGVHDNFFELGGHSVLVTQILSRVRKLFHVDLNLRTVFEAPTVAALATKIEEVLIEQIEELIEEEIEKDIPSQNIFIAGLSQGGSVALSVAMTSQYELGGFVALGSFLPYPKILKKYEKVNNKTAPILMSNGQGDKIVEFGAA